MSKFLRAMYEIHTLCRKSDVRGNVRVSITFDTPRDRELFKIEIKRETDALRHLPDPLAEVSEGRAYGVDFRIL